MIYAVEYEMLLHRAGIADGVLNTNHSVETLPLNISAHIYLYLVIRNITGGSQPIHRLVERLCTSLHVRSAEWWGESSDRHYWLLWVLFVGSAAAAGRQERAWLVMDLGRLIQSMGVKTEEDLEYSLKQVLWEEAWCRHHLRPICDEVFHQS